MPADISGLLELAAEYDATGPKVATATVQSVTSVADKALAAAEAAAPRRTGDLAGSGEVTLRGGGGAGGVSARVRFTERYAWFVYAGTARMAPQPEWLDNARDGAERDIATDLTAKIAAVLP